MATPQVTASFAFLAMCYLKRRNENGKNRKVRRWWAKELFRQRLQYGNRLMADMVIQHTEETVRNFVRMSSEDFEYLLTMVSPKINKMNTNMREAITAKERLAVTLRFLATGDSYSSLQYLFRISKSSVSSIIPETCDAIIETLRDYVKMPSNQNEWLEKARGFEEKWAFPHAIGAIDGKHILIQSRINSGTEYCNYKEHFSVVLLAVVDADYNFIFADVSCQDRISDGSVFKNTSLYRKLENGDLNIPPPTVLQVPYGVHIPYMLLGDQAFSSEYMMKPFEGTPQSGSAERIFNYRHSRARRVVENAFGILSSVFCVLRKPMLLSPEIVTKVTLATIYLHNFLRQKSSHKIYTPPGTFDSELEGEFIAGTWRRQNDQDLQSFLPLRNVPRRAAENAKNIRLHLGNHFVLNNALPWQHTY
ncbi:hypothetical protein WA026_004027 [Henosepilachna vigintioctopunctata]|uniref:DDE Tnp4 domain-containing protein n=1 Tax=Henosepilachna vigintioctopunctata TaxID=420089 RepID=A0AAW1UID8_9CUCU